MAIGSIALSLSSWLGTDYGWLPGASAVEPLLSHALIEWTAAGLALGIAFLAWTAWRQKPDRPSFFLFTLLPAVALLDMLHALESASAIGENFNAQAGLGLAGLVSRLWMALAVAGCLIADHLPAAFERPKRWLIALFLGTSLLVTVLAASIQIDLLSYQRLLNFAPFILLALATILHLAAPGRSSILMLGILFSVIPQLLCQLEILAATTAFDSHFMLAHWQKLLAYALLLGAVIADRHPYASHLTEENFHLARRQLQDATQELERVDRELVQQERQRRLAETSLRMLEKAVETMSMGVTVTDPDGRIVYVNPADAQMHGYSVEELLGRNSDLFAADGSHESTAPVMAAQPWTRERLNKHRGGQTFPARLVSDQVRDESGHHIGTVTICEDISAQKQIQEALERRDRVLEAVGLAAERFLGEASWEKSFGEVLEHLGRATRVDRVYVNLEFESRSSEGITRSWAPPDGDLDETSGLLDLPPRAGLFLRWRARLQLGEILHGPVSSLPPYEREVLEARGVRSVAAVPIFVGQEFYGYLSLEDSEEHRQWPSVELEALKIAADLLGTAIHKRQASRALAASEAQFRDLLENANDLIQSISPEGRFLFVNAAWKAALGYSDHEVERLSLWDVIHPAHRERCRQLVDHLLAEDGSGRLEAIFITSDQREIAVEGGLNCRYHEGRPVAIRGIFRDITARRVVDRMKQEFISMVSHELRTPLTSIIAGLGLLKGGKLDSKPDRAKELLTVAHRNSNRLLQLINDLLDIQKLAANRLTFSVDTLNVQELLEGCTQAIRSFAESHNISIQIEDTPAELCLRGDRQRLHQVLNHLLSNAIKFSPPGQPVTLRAETLQETVRIAVEDRGVGIPEEFQNRLFDQFTQADSSHTRSHGGTGLGLSIVKGMVEGMNGQVSLDSEIGRGTTFYVELPIGRQ